MKLYISAQDQAMRSKFSKYVQLLSINKIFQHRYASVILCSEGEVYIFLAWVLYLCFGRREEVVIKHVGSSDICVKHL